MENRQQELARWMEIFLRKGHVNPMSFGDEPENPANTMEFMRKYGMDKIYNQYILAARDAEHTLSDEQRARDEAMLDDMAKVFKMQAGKVLYENKIFINVLYDKMDKEAAKASVRSQLSGMGISDEVIDKLYLDNLDDLQVNDKTLTIRVKNDPTVLQFFKDNDFNYKVEGNELVAEAVIHVEEGISVDNTEENRKILDENEIEYILMAEGKNPKGSPSRLFIPQSWDAFAYSVSNQSVRCTNRIINSQFSKNAALLFGMLGATALFNPAVAWCVFIAVKRSGIMRDKGNRAPELDLYKSRAVDAGHTVLTTQKRHNRLEEVYVYKLDGKVRSIPARDVRIPDHIKGVHLSADQRERFRRGELLELTDKEGQKFAVRIDVTQPDLVRQHYKVLRTDKQPTAAPNRLSPDTEKLDYIARFGYKGVSDIYGKQGINYHRDKFLQEHGLLEQFNQTQKAAYSINKGRDENEKQQNQQEFNKCDAALKDLANNLVLSQRKQNGMGI